jgi:hypothetical protein
VGYGVLVPAPQEKGKQGKEFGFLDLKSFESLDVKYSSLPIEVYYA